MVDEIGFTTGFSRSAEESQSFRKKKTRVLEVLHGVYREVSQSLVITRYFSL